MHCCFHAYRAERRALQAQLWLPNIIPRERGSACQYGSQASIVRIIYIMEYKLTCIRLFSLLLFNRHFQLEPVIGWLKTIWQFGAEFSEIEVDVHMGEDCPPWAQASGGFHGF